MISELEKKIITENIIWQANCFLKEMGEFYPFGAIVSSENEIRTLGMQLEDDYPKSDLVAERLTDAILEKIQSNQYKYAAIGLDVLVNKDESKIDALEIRLFDSDCSNEKIFYAYHKTLSVYDFHLIEL